MEADFFFLSLLGELMQFVGFPIQLIFTAIYGLLYVDFTTLG